MKTSLKNIITVKPRINKCNGQINVSLPRGKMPKDLIDNIFDIKQLKIELAGWD